MGEAMIGHSAWEYMYRYIDDVDMCNQEMARDGLNGWELVQVVPMPLRRLYLIFKRPVVPESY